MEFVFGEVYALGVAAFKYLGDGLPGCAVDSYPTSAMVFKFWDRVHYASSPISSIADMTRASNSPYAMLVARLS